MKKEISLAVCIDAEGCTGIANWKDVITNYKTDNPTEKVKKAMAEDVNALIKGAKKAPMAQPYNRNPAIYPPFAV